VEWCDGQLSSAKYSVWTYEPGDELKDPAVALNELRSRLADSVPKASRRGRSARQLSEWRTRFGNGYGVGSGGAASSGDTIHSFTMRFGTPDFDESRARGRGGS